MNLNRVTLAGRLTRDPELRYSAKGVPVCKLSLAITTRRRSGEETKEETTFVDVTAFHKQAETIGQNCKKGGQIYMEGKLNLESWTDKQTNQPRTKLGVILDNFQFVGARPVSDQDAPAPRPAASPTQMPADNDDNCDVPF